MFPPLLETSLGRIPKQILQGNGYKYNAFSFEKVLQAEMRRKV